MSSQYRPVAVLNFFLRIFMHFDAVWYTTSEVNNIEHDVAVIYNYHGCFRVFFLAPDAWISIGAQTRPFLKQPGCLIDMPGAFRVYS